MTNRTHFGYYYYYFYFFLSSLCGLPLSQHLRQNFYLACSCVPLNMFFLSAWVFFISFEDFFVLLWRTKYVRRWSEILTAVSSRESSSNDKTKMDFIVLCFFFRFYRLVWLKWFIVPFTLLLIRFACSIPFFFNIIFVDSFTCYLRSSSPFCTVFISYLISWLCYRLLDKSSISTVNNDINISFYLSSIDLARHKSLVYSYQIFDNTQLYHRYWFIPTYRFPAAYLWLRLFFLVFVYAFYLLVYYLSIIYCFVSA